MLRMQNKEQNQMHDIASSLRSHTEQHKLNNSAYYNVGLLNLLYTLYFDR